MPRRRSPRSISTARSVKPRRQKLVGKDLDLLLLAGCSCLLTVLYHPVTEALQSSPTSSNSQAAVATQVSKTPVIQTGPLHTITPPNREEIKEEEEA